MKTPSSKRSDAQVREFESRDLGGDIRRSATARVVRRGAKAIPVIVDDDSAQKLRAK
jgi:hypothetical protein